MINIADIIVIAFIILSAFIGYKRGFVKTGLGFLSFFIALILTFMFYKPVMGLIKDNTGFDEWLTEYLNNINLVKEDSNKDSEKLTDSGETYIDKLPSMIVNLMDLDEIKEAKENAKNAIIEKIVNFALKLLAIIVVYIVARISLLIITLVLDLIAKLPVLKQFNEMLGLALGIVLGLIRVYAVLMIVTLLGSLPVANGIVSAINNSLIVSYLYDNNLLLKLLF